MNERSLTITLTNQERLYLYSILKLYELENKNKKANEKVKLLISKVLEMK